MTLHDNLYGNLYGRSVIIAEYPAQRRKHRKKRINKKWAKKYGTVMASPLEDGQLVWSRIGNCWMMNARTYALLQDKYHLKSEG